MNLEQAQRIFAKACRRQADRVEIERAFVGDERLSAALRMEIYAGAFFARQLGALREFYPKASEALGADFVALGRLYILKHPGRHAALETMTRDFPGFLAENAGLPETAIASFVIELAELEQAKMDVLLGPNTEASLTHAQLTEFQAGVRLGLNPGLRLVGVGRIAIELFDPELRAAGDLTWVLFGRPKFAVRYRTLDADEYLALVRLGQTCSLGELCEVFLEAPSPVERAHQVLSSLLQDGALCLSSETP